MNDNNPDNCAENKFVEIPHTELSPVTLEAVIEAFVLREGTDYGQAEFALEKKVEQVLCQLQRGEASILYNLEDQSFDIKMRERAKK